MNILDCLLPAKNVLVYDVAASASGALSVLNDFYNEVRNHENKTIKWTFVISTPHLEETENIKVIRLPWVKKSWIHRLFCDYFTAPKLIKDNDVDKVLSLQNVLVPYIKILQILYLHQSLPFAEYRFKITEDFLFWVYQNIISKFIFSGIKRSERTIVQTKWMKQACIEKTGVKENKIVVIPPVINIVPKKFFSYENMSIPTFIYPAAPFLYKNHQFIVDASKRLVAEGIKDFQVIFTLTGLENKLSQRLLKETKEFKLPIKFIGMMSRDDLFEWYTKAILVFPSKIETFGLPLLEAKMHGEPIIAGRTKFAEEILFEYNNVSYFDFDELGRLFQIKLECISVINKMQT